MKIYTYKTWLAKLFGASSKSVIWFNIEIGKESSTGYMYLGILMAGGIA